MNKKNGYQERFYRKWAASNGLFTHEVIIGETDLLISSDRDITGIAERITAGYRGEIEGYIKRHPGFKTSLEPMEADPEAPAIIKEMFYASESAGVGPMASVAGALSEFTGRKLLSYTSQVIVENGGDIFMKSDIDRKVAIFAGDSPLTNRLFVKIKHQSTPVGICTSSGTVGHSLSFGKADACVIIAKSASLADAVATAACNRVKDKKDIRKALDFALAVKGVSGALVIYGEQLGILGDVEIYGG